MYQYFLGEKSNLATRTEDKPIVIAADKAANFKINEWLDLFRLDLDVLINGIRTVVDTEICSIENMTKSAMELNLENGKTAELGFVYIDDEHPRFLVKYESTKFLCSPNSVMVIERQMEEIEDVKFEVTYTPISQLISISCESEISISIEFNSTDFTTFGKLKNDFSKISDISEMYNLLEWVYRFLPNDANHIFLEINREAKSAVDIVEIKNKKVKEYTVGIGSLRVRLSDKMSGDITVSGANAGEYDFEDIKEKGKWILNCMVKKMRRLNEFLEK